MKRILGMLLVGCVCLAVAPTQAKPIAPSGSLPAQPPGRDGYVVPPGYDRNHIQVKFLDDLDIGMVSSSSWPVGRSGNVLRSPGAQGLFHKIFAAGGVWSRLAGSDEATMDKLRARAQENLGRQVADMNNYFILRVPPGLNAEELVDAFKKLPEVEFASAMPLPMPAPLPAYIRAELRSHPKALRHFEALPASQRRRYIAWIGSARREDTKLRRLQEAIRLLTAGKVLGLK